MTRLDRGAKAGALAILTVLSFTSTDTAHAQGPDVPRILPRTFDGMRLRASQSRLTKYCTFVGPDVFECRRIQDILAELPLTADMRALTRVGLDRISDLGGQAGSGGDTLVNCVGLARGFDKDNFVTLATASSFAGTGPNAGSTSVPGRAAIGLGNPKTPLQRDVNAMNNACGQRAMDEATSTLGNPGGGSPDYQRAVQNAVQSMDAAMTNCRRSGNSLVAQPSAGESGQQAPATSSTGGGADQDTEDLKKATLTFVNWAAGALQLSTADISAIEKEVATIGTNTAGSPKGKAAVATVLLGVVGKVLFIGGFIDAQEHEQLANFISTSSDVVQVAGFVADAIVVFSEAGGAGAAAGGAAAAGGSAALPVVAAALGAGLTIYSAYNLSDKYMAPAVGGRLGELWGDAMWNRTYGPRGGGAKRPLPEGGATCEDMRARWEAFKGYCSQSGNQWRTYDCARFIAFMNGCPDPALINPGPNGDYECRGRRSDADKRKKACELHNRTRSLFASGAGRVAITDNQRMTRQSCSGAGLVAPSRIDCSRINPGQDGSLCGSGPTIPGGRTSPTGPAPGLRRPGL